MNHVIVKQSFDVIKQTLGQQWTRSDPKDSMRIQNLVSDAKWEKKTQNMANKILDVEKAMRRAQAAWENPTLCLEDKTKMMNIFVQRVLELKVSWLTPVIIAKVKLLQGKMLNG